ncbi:hypothetical protein [Chryseobacterium gossypii]|uniref:hypothetical protein n=1 Tax=Chryseobacterium gossypii TaxID=3231602 RepID=UPI003523A677
MEDKNWGGNLWKNYSQSGNRAISGGIGAVAGASALAASGVTGVVLGGVIAGGVGGAVGGAISGAMTDGLFGENIAKGALTGFATGAIGGAVLGGIAGGVSQIAQNAKVTSTGVGTKGNIWTGATVAEGRSPWAFNNTAKVTPKTTTVGGTPKVSSSGKIGKLELGEIEAQVEKTVGYNINPQTEEMTPITKWDEYKVVPGQQPEYTFSKHAGKHLNEVVQRGENAGLLSRPYMRSPFTIKNIMSTGNGVPDATWPGGMNWKVPGTFRGSEGIFELGINPETNVIYHFNFVK